SSDMPCGPSAPLCVVGQTVRAAHSDVERAYRRKGIAIPFAGQTNQGREKRWRALGVKSLGPVEKLTFE
ncbi:MAG: hypothetical protein ABSC55_18480, partial [Syntrophorhabdales bacterium]